MAGRCGAGAGWNAGAAGRAIAGAAGRATAAGAAPRLGCCAEASMLPAIRERPTKEAAKGSAKPTLSGSTVVSSLSYPAPHASITRERGKRSAHERRARIIAALQDGLVRIPRLIAIAQVHDLDCDQGNVRSVPDATLRRRQKQRNYSRVQSDRRGTRRMDASAVGCEAKALQRSLPDEATGAMPSECVLSCAGR